MGFLFGEHRKNDNDVGEWVAWGGITRPIVMQQRGGSYFSVISYKPYRKGAPLAFPDFSRGWVLVNEHQHTPGQDSRDYLTILWNPFVTMGRTYVENAVDIGKGKKRIRTEQSIDYFSYVVRLLCAELKKVTEAKVLEYQDLMDYISYALTLGDDHVPMPEVPLYMDYLLTQNNDFSFGGNGIRVNGKNIRVISLADILEPDLYYTFLDSHYAYRHVRRMLCFSHEEAKEDLKKYTERWCASRRSMKKEMMQGIASGLSGYYHEGLFFHFAPGGEEKRSLAHIRQNLDRLGLFYRMEWYNLKDCWWGSLPGNFLANIVPPITGFDSAEDLLTHPIDTKKVEQRRKFDAALIKSLNRKKISDGEASGLMFETKEQLEQRKEGLEYVQDGPI